MITYVKGNLFESPAQVLVNTVNTDGVMGKGIALQFKKIYPEMFKEYQTLCEAGTLDIGRLHLFRTPHKWILNFPTKRHWRQPSKVEYIDAGLRAFVKAYAEAGIQSIAFPPLGCGNGQLNFATQVEPLMKRHLERIPIDVFIYPERRADHVAEHLDAAAITEWLRSEPASLPFEEVWLDIVQILGSSSSLRTTSGSLIEVKVEATNSPSLVVEAGERKYRYGPEDLLEFWQQLRQYGFTHRQIAPQQNRFSYLMPVFERLPYVRRVEVSMSADGLENNSSTALQVRPKPRPPVGDLFSAVS